MHGYPPNTAGSALHTLPVSGSKSEDPLSPDYVPSIFEFVASPVKRKRKIELESYIRRKRSRLAHSEEATA